MRRLIVQNIKKHIIDKLIDLRPTAATIDVLLYICKYQSDAGFIKGIYYKDVCDNVQITPPTFYAAIKWLEDNRFVSYRKNDWLYDIKILNNDFTNFPDVIPETEKEKWRYLSIAKQIFSEHNF